MGNDKFKVSKMKAIKLIEQAILEKKLTQFSGDLNNKYSKDLCAFFKAKYALPVSSGTAALHTALLAAGIREGDEVLVPATAIGLSIAPLLHIGAKPIFVDVTKNLDFDYEDFQSKITPKTKAVLIVYLWGILPNIEKIKELANQHTLRVVEDAAQAHGSKYGNKYAGTLFDVGCFSTFETKLISTGEGGFILTDSDDIFDVARTFVNNGLSANRPQVLGLNYRINELTAALGIESVYELQKKLTKIKISVKEYEDIFENLKDFEIIKGFGECNNYNFVVLYTGNRDPETVHSKLKNRGIITDRVQYSWKPCFENELCLTKANCPNSEYIIPRIINISLYPDASPADRLANALKEI